MKKVFSTLAVLLLMGTLVTSCKNNSQTENPQPMENQEIVINNILSRKSVRNFTNDTISQEMIELLLRAAMSAPTGMNVQPWQFVVLTDKSQYDTIFGDNFNMRMYKEAAAVVIFCADTTVTRPPRDNPDAPAVTTANQIWRDDMGACTENFLLAAEAHGLGACWTACYPFHDRMDPIRKALELPDNIVPYSVVPVGVPSQDDQPKDKWKPEKIHFGRW